MAERSLTAFYLWNLNNQTSYFFNSERFSAVPCSQSECYGKRLVDCKLQSFGISSELDLFLIGRNEKQDLVAVPLNGKTLQHLTHSGKSETLNADAQARTFLEAYEELRAYMATFVGTAINVNELKNSFD